MSKENVSSTEKVIDILGRSLVFHIVSIIAVTGSMFLGLMSFEYLHIATWYVSTSALLSFVLYVLSYYHITNKYDLEVRDGYYE